MAAKLAPEIIAYILDDRFEAKLLISDKPHPRRPKPLPRLAQLVCKTWRDIVNNHSHLFLVTCIFDSNAREFDKTMPNIEKYEEWLKSSDKCDIDVWLHGWNHRSWHAVQGPYKASQRPPFDVVAPYAHRWRILRAEKFDFRDALSLAAGFQSLSLHRYVPGVRSCEFLDMAYDPQIGSSAVDRRS